MFWSPQFKKYVHRLKWVQRKITKMTKGLKSLPNEERLKTLCLFAMKRGVNWDLNTVFQHLKVAIKEIVAVFIRSHMEKTRGSRYKLQWEMFHLGIRKKSFTVGRINDWNNLPRDVVESPSLKVSRCDWTVF